MLTIKANKLSKIRDDFNHSFPYLKLEFFRDLPKVHAGSQTQIPVNEDTFIKAVNGSDEIIIDENMQVSDLEQQFRYKFGLSAQVLRIAGNLWIETAKTRDWSLKKQNEEGKELSRFKSL